MAEVVGVVDDVHLADARTPPRPAVFLSTHRFPSTERDIIVRGTGDANALLGELRQSLAAVDATIPLFRATSLDRAVAITMAQDRLTTSLLAAFAVLALLLAAVGVYGVLSGDVTRRRKEIGIRLALGANGAAVTSMVLRRALTPAVVGVGIGIGLALVLARSMSALVFGIGAYACRAYFWRRHRSAACRCDVRVDHSRGSSNACLAARGDSNGLTLPRVILAPLVILRSGPRRVILRSEATKDRCPSKAVQLPWR